MERPWLSSISEIEKNLDTSVSSGLTEKQAIERLGVYGHNRLVKKKKRPTIFLFFEQFRSFIIWILIVAAIISGLLQEWIDTFAIIGIVILNAFLGFIQEFKAEKALEGLKKLFSHYTRVIREGFVKTIPSELLVPGDIIEIEAGDNISADCRVVWHTSNFTVQEASLTGESVPVFKTNMPLNDPDAIIGDRNNMVYMGTNVASGRAKCVVVNTGMETELGKITEMIQEEKYEKTPLQEKLEGFGKSLVYICLGLVGIIFLMEYARGGKFVDVFLTSVSLAVAAVPEGLPAVVTIGLALGVQRMAKRNVLIRKLPSVETLGCATVICSDKTGTLTKNEMTVTKIYADDTIFDVTGTGYCPQGHFMVNEKPVDVENFPGLGKSLLCATICNISNLVNKDGNWEVVGDPTEGALLVAAAKAGKIKEQIDKDFKIVDEIPFDSERKRMSVIVKYKQETLIFIKGAPDVLLNLCSFIDENGIVRPLDDFTRQKITNIINSFAEKALRIIATGYRKLESNVEITQENIEKDIIFSGLLAMIDPPRDEAKAAIQKCKSAGIKVKMITGDHKQSAIAIAKELSLLEKEDASISGDQLDKMDDMQLVKVVQNASVYARVSPHHKLRVVKALKNNNEIVAMTGDGVNDAPAVKEADIGVAMGITGTDVTKEVADMIITDDNFVSIVAAIEQGRGIYENITKFVNYLLSCNVAEIMVMFFASLFNMPVPLLPIQILWINIVTDGLPALALGVDPVDPLNMQKPPRKPDEPILDWNKGKVILGQGFFITLCALIAFWYVLYVEDAGLLKGRTVAFFVLACSQLFHSFNLRSNTKSIFHLGFTSNIKLVYANIISSLLQISVIFIPIFQPIFKTQTIEGVTLVIAVILSSVPLWGVEIIKYFVRKRKTDIRAFI